MEKTWGRKMALTVLPYTKTLAQCHRTAYAERIRANSIAPIFRSAPRFSQAFRLRSKISAIMYLRIARSGDHELKTVGELEFRAPVRSGVYDLRSLRFEPARPFCYFLGRCQKVKRLTRKKQSDFTKDASFTLLTFFLIKK